MNASGITQITYMEDLGSTPARVNRKTGELQINMKIWKTMPKEHRFFVLLHELGHVALQTRDEKLADHFAHQEYIKRGYSLNQSVLALSRLLRFNKEEDFDRAYLQLRRAQSYDYFVNNNKNVYNHSRL